MSDTSPDEPPSATQTSTDAGGATDETERRRTNVRLPDQITERHDIPDTPGGHGDPYPYVKYHYQPNMYALDLVLFSIAIGMVLGFAELFGSIEAFLDPRHYTIGVTVGATVLTFFVHELIHAAVAKWVGADVSFTLGATLIQTVSTHTFQSRQQTALIAIAPSVAITFAIPPVMLLGSGPLVVGALVALFVNTVGLRHDLYLIWQMYLLPRGALIYNFEDTTLVYEEDAAV